MEARKILLEHLGSDGNGHSISYYLQCLHQHDGAFTYRVQQVGEGCPVGFAWQSLVLRAVFEDQGDCLFANAMKCDMNALHWPYMSLVILDKSIHVAVEAIMSGELTEAYAW